MPISLFAKATAFAPAELAAPTFGSGSVFGAFFAAAAALAAAAAAFSAAFRALSAVSGSRGTGVAVPGVAVASADAVAEAPGVATEVGSAGADGWAAAARSAPVTGAAAWPASSV